MNRSEKAELSRDLREIKQLAPRTYKLVLRAAGRITPEQVHMIRRQLERMKDSMDGRDRYEWHGRFKVQSL